LLKVILDFENEVKYNDVNIEVVRSDVNIEVKERAMKIKTEIKNSYTLGMVIQQSRLQQGFSQRELADMLGIGQKWVWEMEQGKPGVLMDRLFMILEKTGVKLSAEFEARDVSWK